MLTRSQAVNLFGSVKALQAALGLKTHSSIYMWAKDQPIPETHYLRIRYQLRPKSFDGKGRLRTGTKPTPKRSKAAA